MKQHSRTGRRTKRRPFSRKQKLVLLLVGICTLFAVFSALLSRPRPTGVQASIPSYVTQKLLPPNPYSRPETPLREVNAIVIHYVGNPGTSAESNRNYFANLSITGETSASSHFVVGLDGEIIQCVPVNEVAYCSNQRNNDTIGIEVCHPDEEGKFNEATMASVVKLTAWLCDAFDLTADDVIRHYDVTGKECPRYYVRHPDAWETLKDDVRVAIEELHTQNPA